MTDPDDLTKLIADVLERDKRMTSSPWRAGAVEKDKLFVPCACCMGPERVLATMNPHFDYEVDVEGIAVYRSAAPQLAAALRDALAERDSLNRSLKAARYDRVSDASLDWLRSRYDAIQEQVEAHDKRWGAAFCDALSDLDQVRKERDESQASLRDALAEVARLELEIDDLNHRIGGLT